MIVRFNTSLYYIIFLATFCFPHGEIAGLQQHRYPFSGSESLSLDKEMKQERAVWDSAAVLRQDPQDRAAFNVHKTVQALRSRESAKEIFRFASRTKKSRDEGDCVLPAGSSDYTAVENQFIKDETTELSQLPEEKEKSLWQRITDPGLLLHWGTLFVGFAVVGQSLTESSFKPTLQPQNLVFLGASLTSAGHIIREVFYATDPVMKHMKKNQEIINKNLGHLYTKTAHVQFNTALILAGMVAHEKAITKGFSDVKASLESLAKENKAAHAHTVEQLSGEIEKISDKLQTLSQNQAEEFGNIKKLLSQLQLTPSVVRSTTTSSVFEQSSFPRSPNLFPILDHSTSTSSKATGGQGLPSSASTRASLPRSLNGKHSKPVSSSSSDSGSSSQNKKIKSYTPLLGISSLLQGGMPSGGDDHYTVPAYSGAGIS